MRKLISKQESTSSRYSVCMCGCAKFQAKQTTLTFSVQICPKMDLGLAIQKTNVGIRISIVKMSCMPIFRKNEQLWLFRPKFAQKWVLGSTFQNSKSGFGDCILEILWAPIFRQNKHLWIFGPKFAQKWILGLEFQKSKSGFGWNEPLQYTMCANFQSKWITFNLPA